MNEPNYKPNYETKLSDASADSSANSSVCKIITCIISNTRLNCGWHRHKSWYQTRRQVSHKRPEMQCCVIAFTPTCHAFQCYISNPADIRSIRYYQDVPFISLTWFLASIFHCCNTARLNSKTWQPVVSVRPRVPFRYPVGFVFIMLQRLNCHPRTCRTSA